MARTYARLAAVAAVAAGVVLSAGAGAAVADADSQDGTTTNEQANNGSPGNSGGKTSSGKSGSKDGAGSGSRKSDKSGNSSGSGNGSGGKDHSASKTQSGTHSSTGTDATDTSEGNGNGNGNSAGAGNSNGSANSSEGGNSGDTESAGNGNGSNNGSSVDDSSSSPTSTETPATPTVEQPTTTATAAATPTATATTVPTAPAGPTPTRVTNNNTFTSTPPAPGAHPSAASQPGRSPAAPVPGIGAGGRSAGDAAAISTRLVSDRDGAGKPTDGATPNSARGWLTKVGNEFIQSVTTALREVTLKDLALAALPGIAGLIFVFTTGIGLGHRQAKFGFLMETTGALRFAARGPLGVVRSGGFIAVRARKAAMRGPAGSTAVDRAA